MGVDHKGAGSALPGSMAKPLPKPKMPSKLDMMLAADKAVNHEDAHADEHAQTEYGDLEPDPWD